MREIKFSYIAQHEETGLFMEQIFTMEEIEGSDFLNQWRKTFKRFGKWIARRQFTGLKDKNGKEIYEGDIVEDYYGIPAIVFWVKTGIWGVKYSKRAKTWCDMNVVDKLSLWTVIGNIYKNPELIKK